MTRSLRLQYLTPTAIAMWPAERLTKKMPMSIYTHAIFTNSTHHYPDILPSYFFCYTSVAWIASLVALKQDAVGI